MISVVVVGDHPLFREGIVALIDGKSGICVVAQGGNGEEAVALSTRHRPEVMLIDVEVPGPSVLLTLRRVAQASRSTRVVVVTTHDDPALGRSLLDGGVSAFLSKRSLAREVIDEVARAADSPPAPIRAAAAAPALTPREIEVLTLVAAGMSNASIAEHLFISPGTVKRHLSQTYPKLGVRSRTAAVRDARLHGFVT